MRQEEEAKNQEMTRKNRNMFYPSVEVDEEGSPLDEINPYVDVEKSR
jgi:hypothetical protein